MTNCQKKNTPIKEFLYTLHAKKVFEQKIHIHNENPKAFKQISFELSTPLGEIMMIDD